MKKVLSIFFAVNLAFAMIFTAAYAQEADPPPPADEVVVEETEEVVVEETEEVVPEEALAVEDPPVDSPQELMMMSAAAGPSTDDPIVDLGLPDPGPSGLFNSICQPSSSCDKITDHVKDGGEFTSPLPSPSVVVVMAGTGQNQKEYFFPVSGTTACNLVTGGDPYCMVDKGNDVFEIQVNPCLTLDKQGRCEAAENIVNIQFWLAGGVVPTPTEPPVDPTATPRPGDPTPTPKPKPTKVPGKPQVYPEANTGAVFGALAGMSWFFTGVSGISLGIVSLKKRRK